LRKAHEHDVTVAPRLLTGLSYTVVTGDKGYVSQPLREQFAPFAVDVIAKRRSNQNPAPPRELFLLQQHKQVETTFSSLDTRGLLVRRYRKPWGLVFHLFSVLLADFFHRLFQRFPTLGLLSPFSWLLSRIGVLYMNVHLTQHFEKFIDGSASEVVRDALRLLEEQDQNKALRLQALKEDLQKGLDSGDSVPFDAEGIKKKARARHKQQIRKA
jgi:antitoxin ParD1/3/4